MDLDFFGTHPVESEPMKEFTQWYTEARRKLSPWSHNFALTTVDSTGQPHSRTVSLHTHDERGFVFCSNFEGPKSEQLLQNPRANMVFMWEGTRRTVRINGTVQKIDEEDSKKLFARCRPEEQLYFYSSSQGKDHPYNQSNLYQNHSEYVNYLISLREQFGFPKEQIPYPKAWGGYRVEPASIEFLDLGPMQLGRFKYRKEGGEWKLEKLVV